MKLHLLRWFSARVRNHRTRSVVFTRPQLEVLDDRVVPALLNHGGPILASVQAQAVYLGSGWSGSAPFDNFLTATVNGTTPYLTMLHNAGFTGVTSAGSTLSSVSDSIPVPSTLTDTAIRSELQREVDAHTLQPSTSTLYFVFVQPGVVVDIGNGQNSTNTFLAYHTSFAYNGNLIRYAVVPYHGSAGNAQNVWLTSAFDSMTMAASHELAEAITDPDGTAWFDRFGNEVGDIVNGSTVYLNGYAVQREASIPASFSNFLAMTPAGSKAGHSVTFSIVSGALTVAETGGSTFTAANPTGETGPVVSISTQGIDQFGQPMTDVVFGDGNAYEYHDFIEPNPTADANPSFFPWTSLGKNIKQAVAGQGVSYVLLTNGNMGEYVDPDYNTSSYGYGVNPGSRGGVIASGVTFIIAAGTDQLGVNAVEYTATVKGKTSTYVWRDVNGQASTSTAGFTPASSFSALIGPFGLSSSLLSLGDVDSPATSTRQPTRVTASSDPGAVQFTLIVARPSGETPLSTTVSAAISVVGSTAPIDTAGPPQGSLLPIHRLQSSGGPVVSPDEDEDEPNGWEVSILPRTLLATMSGVPHRPQGEAPPLTATNELWAALDKTDFNHEVRHLADGDEVWIARAEQESLPVREESASPALGLVAAALLPCIRVSQRRVRRGRSRLVCERLGDRSGGS